ncbi:MAG: alkaline phosphatase family protein [Nitrospirae bacterium]|nr:alkaline phosphatase family protein [Nitrospirota bacterium]
MTAATDNARPWNDCRLFILGLDGGSFDLIHPWVKEGKLPNFGRYLNESSSGELQSTLPPMTFPGWSTMMTGKNPGRHGIYDFTQRRLGTYEIDIINAADRKAKTIWRILSDAGRRVASVGVPVSFPPEPVNGVMISGFDAPVNDSRIMFPPELFEELNGAMGGYVTSADFARDIAKGRIDQSVAALLASVDRKWATAEYLLKREPWDCMMLVFGETDACIHYFWKYHDPASPHHDPVTAQKTRDPILAVYQRVDRYLGELLDHLPKDATVMLVSDHGVGGSSDKILHLNRWLEQQGLLRFRSTSLSGRLRRIQMKLLNSAKSWVRTVLPKPMIRRIRFRQKGMGMKLESHLRFSILDWKNTTVYSEETPYYPNLWINLKGRDPDGIVEPGADYERVRQSVIDLLQSWRDPDTGQPVVRKAYRREEIYQGPHLDKAPDLIIEWNLDQGYAYLSRPTTASSGRLAVERISYREMQRSNFMINRSGSHREMGIFAVKGPGVKKGHWLAGARIQDVAPTVLYLLDRPVPTDMDGSVLKDGLTEAQLAMRPVQYQEAETAPSEEAAYVYSAEENEKVSERLKSLGYME